MADLFSKGDRVGERFQVESVLIPPMEKEGAFYVVADLKDDKRLYVLQHIPVPNLGADDLVNRQARFVNAVKRIKAISHPQVARIVEVYMDKDERYLVLENVAGTPLKEVLVPTTFVEMGKALGWAMQLCNGLAYLENQAMPVVLDQLDPQYVFVTPMQELKIVNYRLSRIFTPGSSPVFSATRFDRAIPYQAFGRLVEIILRRVYGADDGLARADAQLHFIVRNCLGGGKGAIAYKSFNQVEGALDEYQRHPGSQRPQEDTAEEDLTFWLLCRRVARRLWRQHPIIRGAELCFLTYWMYTLSVFVPNPIVGPVQNGAFVVCWNRLVEVDQNGALLRQLKLNEVPISMQLFKDKLVIFSDRDLKVVNAKTCELVATQPLRRDWVPKATVVSQDNKYLAVCYEKLPQLSIYTSEPKFHLMKDILLPGPAADLASAPSGRLIYASIPQVHGVVGIDLLKQRIGGVLPVPGEPAAITVNPHGDEVWAATSNAEGLFVIGFNPAIVTQEKKRFGEGDFHVTRVTDIGGKRPKKLLFTPEGTSVITLFPETNTLGVVDPNPRKLRYKLSTGKYPVDIGWGFGKRELWICNNRSRQIYVLDVKDKTLKKMIKVAPYPSLLQFLKG